MKPAAGSDNYLKASQGNLMMLSALNTAAATFLKNNTEVLTNGGMPALLATGFTTDVPDFDKLNTNYTLAVQNEREETNAKTVANNAVYTTLVNMLKDAKVIFINNATTRASFTYDAVRCALRKKAKRAIASR